MTSDERHRRMDAARVRAELTVQELWLRYVSLGGSGDAFDLDGYLQGLVPLEPFQQDVLAQALNEALEDGYRAYRVPLSTPLLDGADDDRLGRLIDDLIGGQPPPPPGGGQPPRAPPRGGCSPRPPAAGGEAGPRAPPCPPARAGSAARRAGDRAPRGAPC